MARYKLNPTKKEDIYWYMSTDKKKHYAYITIITVNVERNRNIDLKQCLKLKELLLLLKAQF